MMQFSPYAGCLLWFLIASGASADASEECVKGIDVPAYADMSSWPTLFRLTTPNPGDPTMPNKDESAGDVDPSVLIKAGVVHRFLDPTGYDYPNRTKEIPWNPPVNGTNDATLQALRDQEDYQYADIVVVAAFAEKFYTEHLHAGGDEVRYIIDGSGYFDIRDVNDEWVRMHAYAGDFVEFPTGIEHRFSVDSNNFVQAMRLFPGSGNPDWSSVPRSNMHGNNTSRNAYVEKYLCGVNPDLDQDEHEHNHEDHDTDEDHDSHEDHDNHEDHDSHDHDSHDQDSHSVGSSSDSSAQQRISLSAFVIVAVTTMVGMAFF
uniref:acireductone dioxygenase (Fe(2+)-requiring) n=1 Tax=Corethron hystrix TaxID=216773 RepID=A0A7S1BE60_9STRA|mmetsp:Transcript_23405/g.53412  ORF Transcript_23405/g.53412 Transcript_23405/m.53412 type:complete len:317 (+) Transcript_23405:117-1067(+)